MNIGAFRKNEEDRFHGSDTFTVYAPAPRQLEADILRRHFNGIPWTADVRCSSDLRYRRDSSRASYLKNCRRQTELGAKGEDNIIEKLKKENKTTKMHTNIQAGIKYMHIYNERKREKRESKRLNRSCSSYRVIICCLRIECNDVVTRICYGY